MSFTEVILIALGLSADAFAVSVCKGAAAAPLKRIDPFKCGIWFGLFQGLMPVIGYFLGSAFVKLVSSFAPWIVCVILVAIGGNMIREGFAERRGGESSDSGMGFGAMFTAAVATSIDAMAIGVTFSMSELTLTSLPKTANMFISCAIITVVTFITSYIGAVLGGKVGTRHKFASEVAGGTVLMFIGLKTLAEHLGLVSFMASGNVVFGLLLPFAACVLGATYVFAFKGSMNIELQRALTGFSAGVMVAVAIWCLMLPAAGLAETRPEVPAFIPLMVGFWIGIVSQLALDRFVPHMHNFSDTAEGPAVDMKKSTKIALAAAIHHASEGVGLGVILAGFFLGNTGIGILGALTVIVGMSIQNVCETAVEVVPIKAEGEMGSTTFFLTVLSGAVEPIFGILTLIVACVAPVTIPYIMAYSAAAMLYVVVEELIPEMMGGEHHDRHVIFFALGFSVMMIIALIFKI